MGQDEEGTIRVLAAHRAVIDGIIAFHGRRQVQRPEHGERETVQLSGRSVRGNAGSSRASLVRGCDLTFVKQ